MEDWRSIPNNSPIYKRAESAKPSLSQLPIWFMNNNRNY